MPAKQKIEKVIENGIISLLSMMGCWVFKVHGHLGQRPGIPDILACHKGRLIAIEVKAPAREVVSYTDGRRVRRIAAGAPTELQAAEINAIRAAGGIAFVAWSVEDVLRELERHGISTPFRSLYASAEQEATAAHGSCARCEAGRSETVTSATSIEKDGRTHHKKNARKENSRFRKKAATKEVR